MRDMSPYILASLFGGGERVLVVSLLVFLSCLSQCRTARVYISY